MLARLSSMLRGLATPGGRARARYALSWRVNRVLYRTGFALLSDYFYQPLPPRAALLTPRRVAVPAIDDTLEHQRRRVVEVVTRFGDEVAERFATWGYRRAGAQLSHGDAEVLYAMVRDLRPRRVVEIGSGSSTAVIAAALDRNAEEGQAAEFLSIDPYVTPVVGPLHERVTHRHADQPLQEVDATVWEDLRSGDVLFVDSSHVFKRGSDVEYQFLRLYPLLRDGVVLHVHDVFLPADYPAAWDLERSQFWNEQYVLAAVLQNSSRYEVLACLSALHQDDPALLPGLLDGFPPGSTPGSTWLRVRAESAAAPSPPSA